MDVGLPIHYKERIGTLLFSVEPFPCFHHFLVSDFSFHQYCHVSLSPVLDKIQVDLASKVDGEKEGAHFDGLE